MANHRRYGALEKLSVIISKRSVAPIENELATRSRLGKGTWWWWWWWITGIPVLRGTRYVIAIAYARSLSLSLSSLCLPTHRQRSSLEKRLDRLGKIIVTPGEHANHFATADASHAADYRANIYHGNPLTRIGSYRRL